MLKIYVGLESTNENNHDVIVTFLDEDKAKEWCWYSPKTRIIRETELQ